MKGRPDDTTSQAVVKPWHEQDSPQQLVHTPLEHERAGWVLDAGKFRVKTLLTSPCCSYT